MGAQVSDLTSDSASLPPARGGRWPANPTYQRSPDTQAAFERAVAKLWAQDWWLNQDSGERELNADLVLEGGGVKGIGLAGAICVLAEAGYRFPRAAGTSAGAIAALLVAAVQKASRDMAVLRQYLADIDYSRFMDPVRTSAVGRLIGEFTDVCEPYYGLIAADQLVVSAVRASMSIPFFFVPVQTETFTTQTELSDGQQIRWRGGKVTWVDGGMLMNFPITAFDRADGNQPRWPTIGIKLSAEPSAQSADEPATQFDLSREQQQALFRNGAQAATDFLIKWAGHGGIPRGSCRTR